MKIFFISDIHGKDNIYFLNPGSITLPKENNPHTYGVLENNNFKIP